jgi:raffinose/stachyose/melibiose transport system permease protein
MKSKALAENSQIRATKKWSWLFVLPVTAAFVIGFVWPFLPGHLPFLLQIQDRFERQVHWVFPTTPPPLRTSPSSTPSGIRRSPPSCCLVLINVIAFAVAYALTQGIKGSNIFRTIFFAPNLIGGIVLGYIWSMIFDWHPAAVRHRRWSSRPSMASGA